MLDLVARYENLIQKFSILLYEQEGDLLRLKVKMTFIDGSSLFIKEYVFENQKRKYAYHWADSSDLLICRWDNAGHWTNITTYPHHKHIDGEVVESTETSVADVLSFICKKIGD